MFGTCGVVMTPASLGFIKNVNDLMRICGIEDWATCRVSRKGNRVVEGFGTVSYDSSCGGGQAYCYKVNAVFTKDGSLIQFQVICTDEYVY